MTGETSVQRQLRLEEVRELVRALPEHMIAQGVRRAVSRLEPAARDVLDRKAPWTRAELEAAIDPLPLDAIDKIGAALLKVAAESVLESHDGQLASDD